MTINPFLICPIWVSHGQTCLPCFVVSATWGYSSQGWKFNSSNYQPATMKAFSMGKWRVPSNVIYSVPSDKVHILGMQFSSSRSSDSIPWVWTGGVLRRLWVNVRGEHPKNGAGCPVDWYETKSGGNDPWFSVKTQVLQIFLTSLGLLFIFHPQNMKSIITFQGWNIDIIRTYSKPPIYKGIQTWTKQCMKVINSSRWFGYGMFVNNYSTIPGIVVPNVRTCSLIMVDRSR